jgi:hypothetical protein
MMALRSKLNSGQLADFTRALREQKPDDWDGNIFAMPEMELCQVILTAAREASFYEDGLGPTAEQQRALSYDEAAEQAEDVMRLFNKWNQRRAVSEDEKKST